MAVSVGRSDAERASASRGMRHACQRRPAGLIIWCGVSALLAGAYAFATLATIEAIPCELSLDPQRFCVWWEHSQLATLVGLPAVLAFGCYASLETASRRPVTVAAVLVVLTCIGLREAATPVG